MALPAGRGACQVRKGSVACGRASACNAAWMARCRRGCHGRQARGCNCGCNSCGEAHDGVSLRCGGGRVLAARGCACAITCPPALVADTSLTRPTQRRGAFKARQAATGRRHGGLRSPWRRASMAGQWKAPAGSPPSACARSQLCSFVFMFHAYVYDAPASPHLPRLAVETPLAAVLRQRKTQRVNGRSWCT